MRIFFFIPWRNSSLSERIFSLFTGNVQCFHRNYISSTWQAFCFLFFYTLISKTKKLTLHVHPPIMGGRNCSALQNHTPESLWAWVLLIGRLRVTVPTSSSLGNPQAGVPSLLKAGVLGETQQSAWCLCFLQSSKPGSEQLWLCHWKSPWTSSVIFVRLQNFSELPR